MSMANSTGIVGRSVGGGGRRRLDVELGRVLADARGAGDADVAVAANDGIGIDGADAALDAIAHARECDLAVGDLDAVDGRAVRVERQRLRRGAGIRQALTQQRLVEHGAGDDEFADLRAARPDAGERHVGLHAVDGEARNAAAVLRILKREIVQGDVQRRPQADPGGAVDRQAIARRALDPRRNRRGQEARWDPDHEEKRDHDDDSGDRGAGEFHCSHVDFPTTDERCRTRPLTRPMRVSLSRDGKPLQAVKNSQGVLQSYVTYDTLLRRGFTRFWTLMVPADLPAKLTSKFTRKLK
ncbi:hypothetical protein ACVJDU_000989 [Bradyrhizobium diazoefficiens]